MFKRVIVFLMAIVLSVPVSAADSVQYRLVEQIDRPYVSLFDVPAGTQYSSGEVNRLRSDLERRRDDALEDCESAIERSKERLDDARTQLQVLNKKSSRDTANMAQKRSDLHVEIAALETILRDLRIQLDYIVPAEFEIKLSKLRLIEAWPAQREELDRMVEANKARDRKYGDIDDIGFRALVEGQEKDIDLGGQTLRQLRASGLMPDTVADSSIQDYVRNLAAIVASSSDLKIPLHVSVLASPEVNAMSLPGGFLFVNSGLIEKTESEAQLAGIISHEVARIAARHGHRASRRSGISKSVLQVAQLAAGVFTGGLSSAGAYYSTTYGFQGLGLLVDRAIVGASEKYQREADQLGVQYAWNAGFDPNGFISFLDTIHRSPDRRQTAAFFRTHPVSAERFLQVFSEIRMLPQRESYRSDSDRFQRIKERLRGAD